MTEETFRLPGSSYPEIVKIIRAYGHAPDNAIPKDVAERAALNETIVSRNNAFLVSVGILSGGKKKSMTSAGRALSQALDFEMPDQIASAWRSVTSENDFLRKIVSAVKIRGGMDVPTLRNHIAYTAGEPKKPQTLTGAGAVVDLLLVANLLEETDGKITATSIADASQREVSTHEIGGPTFRDAKRKEGVTPPPSPSPSQVVVNININCSPQDLEGLAPSVRRLLEELRKPATEDTESS